MNFVVIAHDAAEFDDWIDAQRQPGAEPQTVQQARGVELFGEKGCASCHTIDGVSIGDAQPAPDLTHVASRESIIGGLLDPTVPDLRSWISDPHGVKPGALMPQTVLSDAELDAIVAYIEGLR
jgi:cytochrome c oxidase subunit 2